MLFRSALAATLAPLAAAFTVTVTSYCDYPVSLWNVLDSYGAGPPDQTLSSGQSWTSPFQDKTDGGGACVKLKQNDNIFDGGPVSQFEYKMAGSTVFYDWSLINGNCFPGKEVVLQPDNPSCPSVHCEEGAETCPGAYYHPNDLATLACNGGCNLQLFLCGGSGGGSSGGSSPPAPAPVASKPAPVAPKPQTTLSTSASAPAAPATTQAPAAPIGGGFLQEGNDGSIEIVTKITTVITSIPTTVYDTAPTEVAGKREAHLHQHLRRGHARVKGRHAH